MKTEDLHVVILAGGFGTRLKSLFPGIPKPMIPFNSIPLLLDQILFCTSFGIRKFSILLFHEKNQIINFFSKNDYDVEINFLDEPEPLGSGGSILNSLSNLPSNFFVIFGDVYFRVNLLNLYQFHLDKKSDLTCFVHPNNHPYDSDLVSVDNKYKIKKIHPYPHKENFLFSNLVTAGLFFIEKKCLLSPLFTPKTKYDFTKDIIPKLLKGFNIFAFHNSEYIKDVGTPTRYEQCITDLNSGKVEKLSRPKKPAIFFDRDGTIIENIPNLSKTSQITLFDNAANAIKRINDSGYTSILITNQPQIAKGFLTNRDLDQIHNYLELLLSKNNAFIDKIYYCPHHPDSGFPNEVKYLKKKCKCRKPNSLLLNKAVQQFSLDITESWFIGDSTNDIKLANDEEIRSILLNTGLSGRDDKYNCFPDFIFDTFSEAINWILDDYNRIDNIFDQIYNNMESYKYFLFSGFSQSGKSTCSNILKFYLKRKGFKVEVICLDGWLKLDKIEDGHLSKYDINKLNSFISDISKIKNMTSVNIPIYDKFNKSISYKNISIDENTIIIFEGTISFLFKKLLDLRSYKFYIDTDMNIIKKRFFRKYKEAGMSIDEINSLYSLRYANEMMEINESKIISDNVISL